MRQDDFRPILFWIKSLTGNSSLHETLDLFRMVDNPHGSLESWVFSPASTLLAKYEASLRGCFTTYVHYCSDCARTQRATGNFGLVLEGLVITVTGPSESLVLISHYQVYFCLTYCT